MDKVRRMVEQVRRRRSSQAEGPPSGIEPEVVPDGDSTSRVGPNVDRKTKVRFDGPQGEWSPTASVPRQSRTTSRLKRRSRMTLTGELLASLPTAPDAGVQANPGLSPADVRAAVKAALAAGEADRKRVQFESLSTPQEQRPPQAQAQAQAQVQAQAQRPSLHGQPPPPQPHSPYGQPLPQPPPYAQPPPQHPSLPYGQPSPQPPVGQPQPQHSLSPYPQATPQYSPWPYGPHPLQRPSWSYGQPPPQHPYGQPPQHPYGQPPQLPSLQYGQAPPFQGSSLPERPPSPYDQPSPQRPSSPYAQQPPQYPPSQYGEFPLQHPSSPYNQPSPYGQQPPQRPSPYGEQSSQHSYPPYYSQTFPQHSTSSYGHPPPHHPSYGQLTATLPYNPYDQPTFHRPSLPYDQRSPQHTFTPYGQSPPQYPYSPYGEAPFQRPPSPYGDPASLHPSSLYGQPSFQRPSLSYGQPSPRRPSSPYDQPLPQRPSSPYGQPPLQHPSPPYDQPPLQHPSSPYGYPPTQPYGYPQPHDPYTAYGQPSPQSPPSSYELSPLTTSSPPYGPISAQHPPSPYGDPSNFGQFPPAGPSYAYGRPAPQPPSSPFGQLPSQGPLTYGQPPPERPSVYGSPSPREPTSVYESSPAQRPPSPYPPNFGQPPPSPYGQPTKAAAKEQPGLAGAAGGLLPFFKSILPAGLASKILPDEAAKKPAAPASKGAGAQAPKGVGAQTPKGAGAQAPKGAGAQAPKAAKGEPRGVQTPKGAGVPAPKGAGDRAGPAVPGKPPTTAATVPKKLRAAPGAGRVGVRGGRGGGGGGGGGRRRMAPGAMLRVLAQSCWRMGGDIMVLLPWNRRPGDEEEVEAKIMSLKVRLRQIMTALVANLASVCGGVSLAWTTTSLPVLDGEENDVGGDWEDPISNMVLPSQTLSPSEAAWATALMPVGAFVGGLPAGALVSRLGVRRPLLALAVLYVAGWLLIFLAGVAGTACIMVGRLMHGVATGAVTVLVPRYCGDIAEVSIRGSLLSLMDFMLCNGTLLVDGLALVLPVVVHDFLEAAIAVAFGLSFYFMPESPVWLLTKGRKEEATKVMSWLRPGWTDEEVEEELFRLSSDEPVDDDEDERPLQLEAVPPQPPRVGFFGQLRDKLLGARSAAKRAVGKAFDKVATRIHEMQAFERTTVKGMFISCSLMVLSQMCGSGALSLYAPYMFSRAEGALPLGVTTTMVGMMEVAGGVVAPLTVDHVGRRPLLAASGFIMCATLLVLITYDSERVPWLPSVALGIYVSAFEMGLGSLPWFISYELIGPLACGAAVTLDWTLNSVMIESFPYLSHAIGQRRLLAVFASMSAVAAVFSLTLLPETMGKTRGQIQALLRRWPLRPRSSIDTASIAAAPPRRSNTTPVAIVM